VGDDGIRDLQAVVGQAGVIAERPAVVTITEPVIDGAVAEVTVKLWCGMLCVGALNYLVERSDAGKWNVIGSTGG
jgi:hypothetical protein